MAVVVLPKETATKPISSTNLVRLYQFDTWGKNSGHNRQLLNCDPGRRSSRFCLSLLSALCRRRLASSSPSSRLSSSGLVLLRSLSLLLLSSSAFCCSYSRFLLSIVGFALYFCFGNLGLCNSDKMGLNCRKFYTESGPPTGRGPRLGGL